MSFSYFRKFALDCREVLPDTFQNFGGLCYNIQVLCNIWDGALSDKKIANDLKLHWASS